MMFLVHELYRSWKRRIQVCNSDKAIHVGDWIVHRTKKPTSFMLAFFIVIENLAWEFFMGGVINVVDEYGRNSMGR